ncbi:hypothetical protein [Streptomyces sp. NPDC000229]|uniref:hypothetical protein n=1 Tax=Streptomyces sp. NPDC000229 TaxID=3154247 RepID=UPI0033224400
MSRHSATCHPSPSLLAYEAFYTLHYPHYLAYARAHLDNGQADKTVTSVFDALFTAWPSVISSLNPTARAWELLIDHVHGQGTGHPTSGTLPSNTDLLTLTALGYSAEHSADLTGLPLGKVCSLLGQTRVTP